MAETVSNAVAQRAASPVALIHKYSTDFAAVLPTHIKPETWVRLAEGALKKGKRINAPNPKAPDHQHHGKFELEVAAANNPGAFLAALLDAARQGLTPGTEEYYLTPRRVGGKNGRLEILGITGYQGYVELMYRAGAVQSVVVQVVRGNDEYRYQRGIDEVPLHRFTPFARDAARGPLIGVYAYARMMTGAVSQVVELNQDYINRMMAVNPASGGEYSPWVYWETSMWMKSAARQLRKWVPTSAEYRREIARAAAEVQRIVAAPHMPPGVDTPQGDAAENAILDGELVDDPPEDSSPPDEAAEDWPDTAQPGSGAVPAGGAS
jgi:recombination protein RecT